MPFFFAIGFFATVSPETEPVVADAETFVPTVDIGFVGVVAAGFAPGAGVAVVVPVVVVVVVGSGSTTGSTVLLGFGSGFATVVAR